MIRLHSAAVAEAERRYETAMVNVNTIVGRNGSSIAAQFHEPLRERLTQRFDGELPASLREFADLFWKRIASDEVAYFALDGAVGTTLSCWHFVNEAAESAFVGRCTTRGR